MRVPQYLEVQHSAEERRRAPAADRVRAPAAARRPAGRRATAADFVTTLLKKRLFSSPKAFAETIETHLKTMTRRSHAVDGAGAAPEEDQRARSVADLDRAAARAGTRILKPLIDRLEETADDDAAYSESETEALHAVRRMVPPLSQHERDLLQELSAWARQAQDRPDAKLTAFRAWLDPIIQPGDWSDERVIVFTEYRDTQRWLYERLIGGGIPAERIAQLYGGQDVAERRTSRRCSRSHRSWTRCGSCWPPTRRSEGINLQAHCHRLLHWEIPWNPNRLEQRNGRIDRHGQHAPEVDVFHFVPAGWQDAPRRTAARWKTSCTSSMWQ